MAAPFASVLADIEAIQLIPRASYDLIRAPPRGYVFALRLEGTNHIFISWSGTTRLAEIHRRIQACSPHPITIMAVLRRDNVHDARTIAEYIMAGLHLSAVRGNWFAVDDVQKIGHMFGNIDQLAPL